MKYLLSIPCVNREERNAINVIDKTFESFEKSGMFDIDVCRLNNIQYKILLFESGSNSISYLSFLQNYIDKYNIEIEVITSNLKLNANTNTFRMFLYISKLKQNDYDYIIWMDDDVWVCKNFIINADIWIKLFGNKSIFTSLYTPYPTYISNRKNVYKHYAQIGSFIGTCCTVFKPRLAQYVIKYWFTDHFEKFNFNPDVRFREGVKKAFNRVASFDVSYPSLVQQMNIGSSIRQNKNINGRLGHTTNTFIGEMNDPCYYTIFKMPVTLPLIQTNTQTEKFIETYGENETKTETETETNK